ncbi:MAG: Gfo/Idh/MocA family protein [Solirubrobacteraceae bacterium]
MAARSRRRLRIGMLGYGFMGRAHSYAVQRINTLASGPPVVLEPVVLCGRSPVAVEEARRTYGWARSAHDWEQLVGDPTLDLFINAGPNGIHAAPAVEALRRRVHVICEKPLARTAREARHMAEAAESSEAVALCGFNYRFFPAIDLARKLVQDGRLGELRHFRSRFLLSTGLGDQEAGWRSRTEAAGSGAVGDLASHHIDLARVLVGEMTEVAACMSRSRLRGADVDESIRALVTFENGATGMLEASTVAGGHVCTSVVEVDGTAGALRFDLARLNELEMRRNGVREVLHVTEPGQPFLASWFPAGHGIGWGDSIVHQLADACWAIVEGGRRPPLGASFRDGYRCAEICDAMVRSASSRRVEPVSYSL